MPKAIKSKQLRRQMKKRNKNVGRKKSDFFKDLKSAWTPGGWPLKARITSRGKK